MSYLELRAVCASKRFYDTEFEATIAAAHTERDVSSPMEAYKCPFGNHWHVKNTIKELRGRHRKFIFCDSCQPADGRANWRKHMHQDAERNRREVEA